jgi:acyl carrier protein
LSIFKITDLLKKALFMEQITDQLPALQMNTAEKENPSTIRLMQQVEMIPADNEKKVKQIICEVLGLEEIQLKPGVKFADDLGIDSLDVFALLVEIENQFRITITEEEAEKLNSPDAIIAFITRQQL